MHKCNSVFGKTMDNLRKRIRVDLVRASTGCNLNLVEELGVVDPAYLSLKIFNGHKSKLKLNRPIYVGQPVLDNSKLLNQIKVEYGDTACLLYTDTDCLLFQVQTEDVDMRKSAEEYDFSDYPKDHRCYSTENKKVIGKFKDECNGRPITEFVGLRPKILSLIGTTSGKLRALRNPL